VTNSQALYELRAEAARMSAPHPIAGVSGSELALLSSAGITPDAAAKPYQVEARIEAARGASDPQVRLGLWLEALAIAPTGQRVRLGAMRAAIALRRDSLALALDQSPEQPQMGFGGAPYYTRRGRYSPYRPETASVLPQAQLTGDERGTLAESLAAAAERLDDLNTAQSYLRQAIALRPPPNQSDAQRDALTLKLDALIAEQNRRAQNAARRPVVKNVIEQDQVVRPRIPRSAP
jgi:hypothetical protein